MKSASKGQNLRFRKGRYEGAERIRNQVLSEGKRTKNVSLRSEASLQVLGTVSAWPEPFRENRGEPKLNPPEAGLGHTSNSQFSWPCSCWGGSS